jgi:hypothetical protein
MYDRRAQLDLSKQGWSVHPVQTNVEATRRDHTPAKRCRSAPGIDVSVPGFAGSYRAAWLKPKWRFDTTRVIVIADST